ncbi:hypothetical protein [Kocuria sp. SM24M-10]|uniref:hypothetical protein n=1 Tax=Kocuria sp. SM24M-10 TaxID=1660349 RepID=UPI00064A405E|nr:hypothetical protein [Kocuria sp. SM24M-10]KLU10626.1 hypothetical protein ABL57_05645 [Kocuria sp. SM24M-10]
MSTNDTTTPEASSEEPQQPQGTGSPSEPAETPQEKPSGSEEDTTLAKVRKEAAGHRVAAKEARAEADALRSQLTAAQDTILADRLASTGVTLDALRAAGHRDAVFTAEGTIDTAALDTAVRDTSTRFGTTLRPAPDSLKGREVPPGGSGDGGASWGDLLRA